jgi:hypothetical protein
LVLASLIASELIQRSLVFEIGLHFSTSSNAPENYRRVSALPPFEAEDALRVTGEVNPKRRLSRLRTANIV